MRIGLTGGIAAGKSTVSQHLRDLGVFVIDYDELAKNVVSQGSVGLERIIQAFGTQAVDGHGDLDRNWMAEHVFAADADPQARRRLDDIEHPLIYRQAALCELNYLHDHHEEPLLVVHDIPLLAEVVNTIPFSFDHIVTVEAPESVRVQRMMDTRAMTEQQARDRIAYQSSAADRRGISDVVIDATLPIEQMFECVDKLVEQWLSQA
jgi:dephospho-CoA kinase